MRGGIDELTERVDALKKRLDFIHRAMVMQFGVLFFLVILIIFALVLGSFAIYRSLDERPVRDEVYKIARESGGR